MKAKFLMLLCCILITFGVSAQYSFPACWTPWTSNANGWPQGTQVSHKSGNWQAKWSTIAEPGTNGDWTLVSKCGDGGIGPDYNGPQKVVGYLPYWVPDFDFLSYDYGNVTHINIAFNLFKQNNNNFNSADFASIEWGTFHNRKVDSILFDLGVLQKAHAKGTKVSVAIGGATDFAFLWLMTKYANDDAKLEQIATFITNYVNTKGIDGVDLDLECWWPDATIAGTTEQGGRVRGDKWGGPDQGPHPAGIGLTKLAQKLRAKMPGKVLSAAVFGTSYYGNNYDDAIAQYLDYIGLMTYDFTGSWNTSPIGPHAALYKIPLGTYQGQTADNPIYSAEDALEYWMGMAPAAWNHDGGFNVPKAKLCIGVPFYGYDLATRKPNNANGFVAPKWKEIVAEFPNAATSFDPLDTRQLGGYIGANGKKLYYETPKGAAEKIKYTKRFGHQGLIIWELTGDVDYSSSSSILKAIKNAIIDNPLPVANITAPANNATFAPGANITISATASDNGSVAKVEFYQGNTKLGEDTLSPYSFAWNGVPAGTYQLIAKATDNQGATGTSSIVKIVVGNAAPTATITAPANNSTYSTGTTVTITATATDSDGTISKVEFFAGSTKLGEDTSSPYSFNWTPAAGSYQLTAKATDNGGATGTSAVVNVGVGNSAPATNITAPANNATFAVNSTITISANATDTDGTIAKVEFFAGSTKLGEDTSSPYSYAWMNVAAGSYALTTKATDNGGAIGTSAVVNITVSAACTAPEWNATTQYNGNAEVARSGNKYQAKWWTQGEDPLLKSGPDDVWRLIGPCGGGNNNPTATITSPAHNTSFTSPATISITANASDTDGAIARVEFFQGTTKLGEDTTSPYTYNWQGVAAGTYILTAKAIDNNGGTGTSSGITIMVTNPGNQLPNVSITSPANNTSYTAPASITINATATDTDGTISKVEFFHGSTLLGNDTSSPYSYTWTGVASGTYELTAKATDNLSGTKTSATVMVTVTGGSDNCSTVAQYVENGGYVAGSIVKNAGSRYECKPHPYTGWCNGAAWAYAPGSGQYWTDAWILKGSCSAGARESVEEMHVEDSSIDHDGMSIYPNPGQTSRESFTLTFSSDPGLLQIEMKDINGRRIIARPNEHVSKNIVTVETPSLASGVYLIRVKSARKTWLRKYLIQ